MPAPLVRNPRKLFRYFERSLEGAMNRSRATKKNPGDDRIRRTEKSYRSLDQGKLPARMTRIHNTIILSTALRNLKIATMATKRQITILEKLGMQYLYACDVRNRMLNRLLEKYGQSENWPTEQENRFTLLVNKSVDELIHLQEFGDSIQADLGKNIVKEIDGVSRLVFKMMGDWY